MSTPVRLLWLDSNVNLNMQERLRAIVPNLSVLSNLDDCLDDICSTSSIPNSVILLVSGSFGEQIAELVDALPQLRAIYIYCCDTSKQIAWATQHSKIGANRVFNQENDMIMQLTAELNGTIIQTPSSNIIKNENEITRRDETLVFSVFAGNTQNNSTRDLTEEKITFIWLQVLTDVLIHMPKLEKEARDEMIAVCRQENKNNQSQLIIIDEFYTRYTPDNAIRWYTRDACFYKLLNQALRAQDFEIIFKFRAFVSDIYKQLYNLFTSAVYISPSFRVYRGQTMALSELEKLRSNEGGLIAMNSFVSTSRNENVALCYIGGSNLESEMAVVLFEMTIDVGIAQAAGTPWANIQNHSYFCDEEEILLSMGTIFRVDSIKQEPFDSSNVWRIKATMCTINDDQQIKMLVDYAKDNICSRETLTFSTYGRFLAYMSRFDSSIAYHHHLLAQLPSDHSNLPTIHNDLAYAYRESDRFSDAFEHYKIAIELKEKRIPRDNVDLATTYSDFGWLLMRMKDMAKSLEFHHKALTIREQYLGDTHLDTAMSYNCVGLNYLDAKDFDLALFYLQAALDIRQRCLPLHHPYTAMSYSSLGSYFYARNSYSEALKMCEQTLCIYKMSLPPTHKMLARTHSSIASCCVHKNQWEKALEHLTSALTIYRKNNSHEQAATLNSLGLVCFKLCDYRQALASYNEALKLARTFNDNTLAATIEKNMERTNIRKLAT